MSSKKTREKQAKLISQLADICEALEWVMVLPNEETVSGLIIGTKDFAQETAKKVYGEFEILTPKPESQEASNPFPESTLVVELTEEEYNKFLETGELPESANNPQKPTTYH